MEDLHQMMSECSPEILIPQTVNQRIEKRHYDWVKDRSHFFTQKVMTRAWLKIIKEGRTVKYEDYTQMRRACRENFISFAIRLHFNGSFEY